MRKFKNVFVFPLLVLVSICCLSFPSQAGEWKQDRTGWRYVVPPGHAVSGSWFYICGKWYYFHSNGYMAHDRWIGNYYVGSDGAMYRENLTPDGYWVDYKGKWVKDYYCRNLYEYCSDIMLDASIDKLVDKGNYYEIPVFIGGWGAYYDEDAGPDTIARISKNVTVTWWDEQGQRALSFSEYLNTIRRTYKNDMRNSFRMVTPVQDANGYITAFADGMYS